MKLPNRKSAIVSKQKIVDYLLNTSHPDGAGKAKFLYSNGFNLDNWQELAEALIQIALKNNVHTQLETIYGVKYIIDGLLMSPNGNSPFTRTVWIVDEGVDIPRLVTAYPTELGENE